jgi:hypothetical protein
LFFLEFGGQGKLYRIDIAIVGIGKFLNSHNLSNEGNIKVVVFIHRIVV